MAVENKKLKMLGELILKECEISMTLSVFEGGNRSYSTLKSPTNGIICLGIESLKRDNPDKNTFELRKMGHFYHELAHLIFTQFEPMGYYRNLEKITQEAVPAFADQHKVEIITREEDATKELIALFKTHIRAKKSGDLLNMLEDAAIEVRIPGVGTSERRKRKIFAAITAARNYMWKLEGPTVEMGDKIVEQNPADYLNFVLSEIHELGIIGYRRDIKTPLLDKMPEKKEIKDYVKWSKFSSSNTTERKDIVEIIMDILDPVVEEKAKDFAEQFRMALIMGEELLAAFAQMSQGMESELSISIPNMTASGSHNNAKSEYNFRLSDEQERKRQQKAQRSKSDSDSESGSQQDESQDGSDSSESERSDSQGDGSGKDSDSSYSESQDGDSNGNSDSSQSSDSDDQNDPGSDSSSEGSGDEMESGDDKDSNSGSSDKEGDGEGSDSDGQSSQSQPKGSNKKSDTDSNKAGSPSGNEIPSRKKFEQDAEAAVEEALKEAEATDAKKAEKEEGKGIKPTSKTFSPDRMVGNKWHEGVETVFIDHRDPNEWKPHPTDWCDKLAKKTATSINKIVMYSSQAQVAKGLSSGKLSKKSLYRAATDCKVFQRTTPGKKNLFRIALLMDQSGSMSGRKIEQAKKTAWIFASACLRAHIPVSVWGHHTSGYRGQKCTLHRYFTWGDTRSQLAAIGEAEDDGANQDGLAIYQVARDLVANQRPGEKLVLIVLSDGLPAGFNGYYGDEAELDVVNICNAFNKHYGVETIGLGIEMRGRDADGIRRIYGDNAVLVDNSSDLPAETVSLLKKLFV